MRRHAPSPTEPIPAVERYGLVWIDGAAARGGARMSAACEGDRPSCCAPSRSMRRPRASPTQLRRYRFQPNAGIDRHRRDRHGRGCRRASPSPCAAARAMPARLPCSSSSRSTPAARSFAACSTASPPPATASPSFAITMSVCRHCATWSSDKLRREPAPASIEPVYERVSRRACRDAGDCGRTAARRPARRGRPQMAGGATASPASS